MIGDTWLTTITSCSRASSSRSSHAARTRTPSVGERLAPAGNEVQVGAPRAPHVGRYVDAPAARRTCRSRARSTVRRSRPDARTPPPSPGRARSGLATIRAVAGTRAASAAACRRPSSESGGSDAAEQQPARVGVGLAVADEHEHRATVARAAVPGATTIRTWSLLSCPGASGVSSPLPLAACALVLAVGLPAASARTGSHGARVRDPVLLVHGFDGSASGWGAMIDAARAPTGYRSAEIDAIDYDSDASNVDTAKAIAREVVALRARTGARARRRREPLDGRDLVALLRRAAGRIRAASTRGSRSRA